MTRLALIGAGFMARVRGKAARAAGAELVAVAARHAETAAACASELGCGVWVDNYRRVLEQQPDAVLIEVPHAAQHPIVRWALAQGLHVLIGGALAGSAAEGEEIRALATQKGLVVEAGYQARYQDLFETAKALLHDGQLGELVALRSIALWDGDPATWYYDQTMSGGMPLTHMTYCFLNPVRWLLDADPLYVSAFANRKKHTAPHFITEESCTANLLFPNDIPYTLTAGFVKPGTLPGWNLTLIGTDGALDLFPDDMTPGRLTAYLGERTESMAFTCDGFTEQAAAFLSSVNGTDLCRNSPTATIGDLRVAEAITESARTKRTVAL
jgi:myo-inositol 2-dehydrogenase/D-chiro-inositol 1-dehydrogenase